MEDRYLFKAKRIDNGEWVVGNLITNVFFRLGQSIPYILCPDKADYDCFEDFSEENGIFEVQPSTICQCTGLKDDNGNLIWENDVVRVYGDTDDSGNDLYYFYKVVWNKDLCCWWLSDIYTQEDEYLYICLKGIDVIGNIFDNPELVESEE